MTSSAVDVTAKSQLRAIERLMAHSTAQRAWRPLAGSLSSRDRPARARPRTPVARARRGQPRRLPQPAATLVEARRAQEALARRMRGVRLHPGAAARAGDRLAG